MDGNPTAASSAGRRFLFIAAVILAFVAARAAAAPLPTAVGNCSLTAVRQVGYRLSGAPGSGSAVSYANGGSQVSYDTVAAIVHSRVGDSVRLCLVSIPRDCPPGDSRGRVYRATNLRTGESWTAPDSQHSCGGA